MYMRYYDGYPAWGEYSRADRLENDKIAYDEVQPQSLEAAPSCGKETLGEPLETIEEPGSVITGLVHKNSGGIFGSIELDDIILIALLILLLTESKDDFIMPIVIGYLLLSR